MAAPTSCGDGSSGPVEGAHVVISETTVLVALAMAVGTVGIIVPVLPGLLLVWGAFVVWAIAAGTTGGWVGLGVATLLYAAGLVAQYLFPGRRLKAAGVPSWVVGLALLVGVVGLFVVPVVGGPLGFVATVFVVESVKHRDPAVARRATGQALRAVAVNLGVELLTALALVTTWVVTVWVTRA